MRRTLEDATVHKRRLALRSFRWLLLTACLVVAFGLGRLFWSDASDGRDSREIERIEGAQDRAGDNLPVPAAPAQD